MKKYITGLLLLAFAVPSLAVDYVWYCMDQAGVSIERKEYGFAIAGEYQTRQFTKKYKAENILRTNTAPNKALRPWGLYLL